MSNAEEITGSDTASLTAIDVTDYFIASVDHDSGDNITNLKLQKLLYYAQGFHVAMREGDPLFSESVLAWKHWASRPAGIPEIQLQMVSDRPQVILSSRRLRSGGPRAFRRCLVDLRPIQRERLEAMTHEESPWLKTPLTRTISLDLLANYFTPLVEAGRRGRAVDGRPLWPANAFRFQRRKELAKRPAGHRYHRLRLKAMACRGSIDVD